MVESRIFFMMGELWLNYQGSSQNLILPDQVSFNNEATCFISGDGFFGFDLRRSGKFGTESQF